MYGKPREIESSGLLQLKEEIKKYNKFPVDNWSNYLYSLQSLTNRVHENKTILARLYGRIQTQTGYQKPKIPLTQVIQLIREQITGQRRKKAKSLTSSTIVITTSIS